MWPSSPSTLRSGSSQQWAQYSQGEWLREGQSLQWVGGGQRVKRGFLSLFRGPSPPPQHPFSSLGPSPDLLLSPSAQGSCAELPGRPRELSGVRGCGCVGQGSGLRGWATVLAQTRILLGL